jgi:hypothetical protein
MTSGDKSGFQAAEMRFFRSASGITRQDRIESDVRNKLEAESLDSTVYKYRQNWKNHIQLMTETKFPDKWWAINFRE